ncbi:MAG: hypothetical protein JRN29_06025 [Nitrososphaerota archaeon]|nr:hypothetical protein [Nitrososphaerota archaeon]
MKRGSPVVVATTDGRAYYAFVTLLRDMKIQRRDALPWEVGAGAGLLLTTRRERPEWYAGEALLYEDVRDDQTKARYSLISGLYPGAEDEVVVGIDPGGVTGVACLYRGALLAAVSSREQSMVVTLALKVLSLPIARKVVRVGNGDSRGVRLAHAILSRTGDGVEVEMVDESGTSRAKAAGRVSRDIASAMSIARRKGVKLFRGRGRPAG